MDEEFNTVVRQVELGSNLTGVGDKVLNLGECHTVVFQPIL
jgi:hypothetical protein